MPDQHYVLQFSPDSSKHAGWYLRSRHERDFSRDRPVKGLAQASVFYSLDRAEEALRLVGYLWPGATLAAVAVPEGASMLEYVLRVRFQGRMIYFDRRELAEKIHLFLGLNQEDVEHLDRAISDEGKADVVVSGPLPGYAWKLGSDDGRYIAHADIPLDRMLAVIAAPDEPTIRESLSLAAALTRWLVEADPKPVYALRILPGSGKYSGNYIRYGLPVKDAGLASSWTDLELAEENAKKVRQSPGFEVEVVQLDPNTDLRQYYLEVHFPGKMKFFYKPALDDHLHEFLGVDQEDVWPGGGTLRPTGVTLVRVTSQLTGYDWKLDQGLDAYVAVARISAEKMMQVMMQPDEPRINESLSTKLLAALA